MTTSTDSLWIHLTGAGIVSGPEPQQPIVSSPWYVKVLLGFCGWLAALFLLGFIGIGFSDIIDNEIAALVAGLVMVGLAYAMLRIASNDFLEHAALAVSLAGQALVAIGVFQLLDRHDAVAWAMLAIFEIPLMLFIPNFIHRVITTLIASLAFYMSLNLLGVGFAFSGIVLFFAAWLWLNEFTFPRLVRILQPIGYGLTAALIPLKGSALFGYQNLGWYERRPRTELLLQPWMAELLTAAVFIFVVWRLLQRYGTRSNHVVTVAALLAAVLISLASIKAQGITVGIVILLLGFAASNRILSGLGVLALLFFVSAYYYLLDTTLLYKAAYLFAVGVVMLVTRWVLLRLFPEAGEPLHAR